MILRNLDSIAPVELLIRKFELTVFRNDFESRGIKHDGRLSTWGYPIRVRLHGEEPRRFKAHIRKTLDVLARLSGLDIGLFEDLRNGRISMEFYIVPPDRVAPILRSYGESEREIDILSGSICLGTTRNVRNVSEYDVTIILSTLSDEVIRHCIIEEITQGLGLIADTDILQPSIMSDNVPIIDRLPMNDKIMVRTLYDKRLKPGMTRDEAMPIVQKIIPELVTAVKEKGEEALYQRHYEHLIF